MVSYMKKTSEEWSKLMPEVQVIDPDGWDRSDFEYSWHHEQITKEEYLRRRNLSSCRKK